MPQLLTALSGQRVRQTAEITASGSWIVPPRARIVRLFAVGGGGAGGSGLASGTAVNYAGSWGGCGGQVSWIDGTFASLVDGATVSIVIGQGGAPNQTAYGTGGDGSATSIIANGVTILSAAGGKGGRGGGTNAYPNLPVQPSTVRMALGGSPGASGYTNGQDGLPGLEGVGGGGGGASYGTNTNAARGFGVDGGGHGANPNIYATAGSDNTGGGGGGGNSGTTIAAIGYGAPGGSGLVLIDYEVLQ